MKFDTDTIKDDANRRVSKGSDIGIVSYTKAWAYVGGSFLLFMYVATKVGDHFMKDPVTGVLFTAAFVYGLVKLCEAMDK